LHVESPLSIPQQQKALQQVSSAATEHLKCHKPFAENLDNNKQSNRYTFQIIIQTTTPYKLTTFSFCCFG